MIPRRSILAAVVLAAATTPVLVAGSSTETEYDPVGDVAVRRTDPGSNGLLGPGANLPDLISLTAGSWQPLNPGVDPYTGSWRSPSGASIFRIDLVLAGVINPPGTLGLGAAPYEPFAFGPSPLYGFVDCDVDRERDTGGECDGAEVRYLANVARFGEVPEGSISSRVAYSADDYTANYSSYPQYRRSGAEFSLVLCGCFNVTVVNTFGDVDGVFGAGDTWIVRGRFFQRAGGLREASAAWGGSSPQSYDPLVNLRFRHDTVSNTTTVSFVGALTMAGAAALTGQPQQPVDLSVANHTSIQEALQDIIDGANDPMSTCGQGLTSGWAGASPLNSLDASRWRTTAIVATAYATPQESLYVYTDAGWEHVFGDCNRDAQLTAADRQSWLGHLAADDGSPEDCDAAVNNTITVCDFGPNFSLYDLNADGLINTADLALLPPPALGGDANGDCVVNGADLSVLLAAFNTAVTPGSGADFNADGLVNNADLSVLLANFNTACP